MYRDNREQSDIMQNAPQKGIFTMKIMNNLEGQSSSHVEVPSFLAIPLTLQLTCDKKWRTECSGDTYAQNAEQFVHDFFEVKNPTPSESPYLLLPNGFTILMFILNTQWSNGFMCGTLTAVRQIKIPPNATLFCARLKPGTMSKILKHNACDFTDRVVPLPYYFSWANELLRLLCGTQSYEQRCLLTLAFLSRYWDKNYCIRPAVKDVLDLIHKYKGNVRVFDICNMLSQNERSLHKWFSETVGISPKAYVDLVKFLYVLYITTATPIRRLGDVPKEFGYVDQPRMCRAFRKYFGYRAQDILHLDMHELFVPDLFDS